MTTIAIGEFITNNKYLDSLKITQPDPKLLDIFEFIKQNNYTLSNNELFLELWIPLKDKKEILITETLLEFMGYFIVSNMGGQLAHVRNMISIYVVTINNFFIKEFILYKKQ